MITAHLRKFLQSYESTQVSNQPCAVAVSPPIRGFSFHTQSQASTPLHKHADVSHKDFCSPYARRLLHEWLCWTLRACCFLESHHKTGNRGKAKLLLSAVHTTNAIRKEQESKHVISSQTASYQRPKFKIDFLGSPNELGLTFALF